jgi:hypothetical protein
MTDSSLTSADPGVFSGYMMLAFQLDKEVQGKLFWYAVLASYYREFKNQHEDFRGDINVDN